MLLRDRRGPFTALLLLVGYAILLSGGILWVAALLGVPVPHPWHDDPWLGPLLAANLVGLIWRVVMRFVFTAREYGSREGLWAVARIPVCNIIAIMAARRAVGAYIGALRGATVRWDKTFHDTHPAVMMRERQPA